MDLSRQQQGLSFLKNYKQINQVNCVTSISEICGILQIESNWHSSTLADVCFFFFLISGWVEWFNWLGELPSDRYPIPSGLPGAFTSEGPPKLSPMVEGGRWLATSHALSDRCAITIQALLWDVWLLCWEKKTACKCRLGSNRAIFRRREWAVKLQGQRASVRCSDTFPHPPPGSPTPPVTNGYIINFWAFWASAPAQEHPWFVSTAAVCGSEGSKLG